MPRRSCRRRRLVGNRLEVAAGPIGGRVTVGLVVGSVVVGTGLVVARVRAVVSVVRAVVVIGGGDGTAVAAGFAPAVAVGGVAVVQERLGPLHQRGDAQL